MSIVGLCYVLMRFVFVGIIMTIEFVNGCLLNALDKGDVSSIVHCVNMQKTFGSGLALSIKQRYPEVYKEYASKQGHLGFADRVYLDGSNYSKIVWNLYGQDFYGRDKRHGNYGAIADGLATIANNSEKRIVGFPYLMCSDRAGCSWEIILEMIEYYFRSPRHNVKIYKL